MASPLFGTAPLVQVSDVEKSIVFYTETLGFSVRIKNDASRYALFEHDGALIAVIERDAPESLKATSEQTAAQIWLADVSAYWAKIGPMAKKLPKGRCKPPHDRDYDVREIHITDPDGFLIFFTQSLD